MEVANNHHHHPRKNRKSAASAPCNHSPSIATSQNGDALFSNLSKTQPTRYFQTPLVFSIIYTFYADVRRFGPYVSASSPCGNTLSYFTIANYLNFVDNFNFYLEYNFLYYSKTFLTGAHPCSRLTHLEKEIPPLKLSIIGPRSQPL